MTQQRIQDYGSPVIAQSFKSLMSAITKPGVLSGNEFLVDAAYRMRINPGTCVTSQGVIIIEDEVKFLTFNSSSSPIDYTVYYSHTDVDISGGVAAVLTLQAGLLTPDVVSGCILGYVRYPGGGVALQQSFFIQAPYLQLGVITPTKLNAPWFVPIKSMGYVTTYTSGATLNITDGGIETFTPVSFTGNLLSGSAAITSIVPVTSNLYAGWTVTGTYIPSNTTILSIDSLSQITLSNQVTGTLTSATLTAQAPQPLLYMKVRNNGIVTGTITLTFPFKVSENPFSLLQMILSTDINALVTPIFIDSVGIATTLGSGFTGQSSFLLKTETIPETATQTANTIVYLQLMISLSVGKEARIQALGLNTYNLPV